MRSLLCACLLLVSACGRKDEPGRERASDLVETPSEKQEAVRQAFASASASAPASAETDRAELDAFFTKLGAAYRAADAAEINAHWDYVMTTDLVEQQGFPLPPGTDKTKLASMIAAAQAKQVPATAKFTAWDRHEITKIVYLDTTEKDEVQVYLRDYSQLTGAGRTRWWLRKRNRSWAIYDSEELTTAMRLSTLLGVGLTGARDKASWGPRGPDLMAALQAVGEGRFEDAEKQMKLVRGVTFPPALQLFVHFIDGTLLVQNDKLDAALAEYDRALSLNPEAMSVQFARMSALNLKGDFKGALEAGQKYEAAIGTDVDLKLQYARAHVGLKKPDEAERLLKSCLAEVADQTECLADLAHLLPAARQSELDGPLGKLKNFDASLKEALDLCIADERKVGARALLAAAKRVKPASAAVTEYGPRVKAL